MEGKRFESQYDLLRIIEILNRLKNNDGFCAINDKTAPDKIYQAFSVSKKVFKSTLGKLYKNKQITIDKDGIRLVKK